MDYFVWTSELSVGIDEIDQEHMKWIAYINALHLGVEAGKEQDVLKALLNDVIDFSTQHFQHEQTMFLESSYPDAKHHIMLHQGYIKELTILSQRLENEEASVLTYDVLLSMKKWLINHVQEVDRQYVSYVKEKKDQQ